MIYTKKYNINLENNALAKMNDWLQSFNEKIKCASIEEKIIVYQEIYIVLTQRSRGLSDLDNQYKALQKIQNYFIKQIPILAVQLAEEVILQAENIINNNLSSINDIQTCLERLDTAQTHLTPYALNKKLMQAHQTLKATLVIRVTINDYLKAIEKKYMALKNNFNKQLLMYNDCKTLDDIELVTTYHVAANKSNKNLLNFIKEILLKLQDFQKANGLHAESVRDIDYQQILSEFNMHSIQMDNIKLAMICYIQKKEGLAISEKFSKSEELLNKQKAMHQSKFNIQPAEVISKSDTTNSQFINSELVKQLMILSKEIDKMSNYCNPGSKSHDKVGFDLTTAIQKRFYSFINKNKSAIETDTLDNKRLAKFQQSFRVDLHLKDNLLSKNRGYFFFKTTRMAHIEKINSALDNLGKAESIGCFNCW